MELMESFSNSPQAFNFYSYTVNNPVILVDPDGEKVTLIARKVHDSKTFGLGNHVFLLIQPDKPDDFEGETSFTVGGYTDGTKLIKAINAESDSKVEADDIRLSVEIKTPEGKSDTEFINDIMKAYSSYNQDADYNPLSTSGYNSNNFASTLLDESLGSESLMYFWTFDPYGFTPGFGEVIDDFSDKYTNEPNNSWRYEIQTGNADKARESVEEKERGSSIKSKK